MATIGYAQLPVPAGGDSPTVPADIAELAEAVDPHLLQLVEDQADRDNRLADGPAQLLAIAADGTTWLKASASENTWITLWEPLPDWRPITLKSGFETGDVGIGIRRRDLRVSMKGRITRTDGAKIDAPNAVNLGSVPADCTPDGLRTWASACSMAGPTINAAGRLEVLGKNTSSSYGDPGDLLWWYQGETGTPWVDISGDYWMD
ncbi:hypothetical protein [Streptomyces boncukensis]|uniref:hypothetical protein n=1 Tax=Streptomyces boncukensis TaxID=2711219 RepID=UPI001F499FD1|nr:hypothetical protein [Streptomyces boncukensis]